MRPHHTRSRGSMFHLHLSEGVPLCPSVSSLSQGVAGGGGGGVLLCCGRSLLLTDQSSSRVGPGWLRPGPGTAPVLSSQKSHILSRPGSDTNIEHRTISQHLTTSHNISQHLTTQLNTNTRQWYLNRAQSDFQISLKEFSTFYYSKSMVL